jgi:hypothetical protein
VYISNGYNLLCSPCAELFSLNVQHKITTTNVLHDEVDASFCLETSMQVKEEGMAGLVCYQEDTLLGLHAFNFVVLDNKFFFQDLDSIQLLSCFGLSKHNLTEVTLSKDSQEVEMIQANLRLTSWDNLPSWSRPLRRWLWLLLLLRWRPRTCRE